MHRFQFLQNRTAQTVGSIVGFLALCAVAIHLRTSHEMVPYIIKPGEHIISIANDNCQDWQQVVKDNEPALTAKAKKRCADPARARGYYCNGGVTFNGDPMVAANSPQAGDVIYLRKELIDHCATSPLASR